MIRSKLSVDCLQVLILILKSRLLTQKKIVLQIKQLSLPMNVYSMCVCCDMSSDAMCTPEYYSSTPAAATVRRN